ncbi:hypothetical protein PAGA_b0380 [Pseudoalteromonas agarivorans DSM 14585]|uniref:Uncharacterized protein n=1 Tax=Pseudoalteromonas agarivorans DSM 14585 TaxID=1312369 RepID=A0ACA8E232_9GAMM|nr:hypothetical protein PAGA_b0380 [Pseudoalteromonas agarivorans DSM 14585]
MQNLTYLYSTWLRGTAPGAHCFIKWELIVNFQVINYLFYKLNMKTVNV